ncbi:MAG: glycan-binding surface protein [Ginsengibacter sp.]
MLQYRSLHLLLLFIAATGIFIIVGCKKDNTGNGTPGIKQIRAITPAPNDSVLTSAFPGQFVVIQGSNLASAEQISFYGFPATFNSGIFSNTSLVVKVPAIKWDSIPAGKANTVEVVTSGGTATYTFNLNAPVPTITGASNENAVAGTTITITGSDFYGVSNVIFPGGKQGTNLVITGTTQLSVTVPAGITAGDSLRVTGTYGTGASIFVFDNYLSPTTGFLANFEDGDAFFGWQYWGGIKTNESALFPDNTGNYIRVNPSGSITAGDGSWYSDNRAVMVASGAWLPSANLSDPIANYSLKFEVDVKTAWSNGSLMIAPNGNFNYLARYAPWENLSSGQFITDGWQTVIIPLTHFLKNTDGNYDPSGSSAPNIATLTGGTNAATIQIMLYNDSKTPLASFDAAADNVRIVKLK